MFICGAKKSCNLSLEVNSMKTTVTARGQTVIPAKIRKAHQVDISTKLE